MLIRGKLEPEVLSYAASAWECEGCIYISRTIHTNTRTKMTCPCVNVANIDHRLVDFFLQTFGGHIYTETPKRLSKRVIYRWKLHANDAIEFLKLVLPYLKFKRERAKLAIEFWERKSKLSFAERDEYSLRLKALNQGKAPAETKRDDSELNLRSDSPTLVEMPVSC